VVVWSGCDEPQVIHRCYRIGANSFIRKTANRDTTASALSGFFRFWCEAAALPSPA
jgi:DNA-binding NarL/FixJ family response regulator